MQNDQRQVKLDARVEQILAASTQYLAEIDDREDAIELNAIEPLALMGAASVMVGYYATGTEALEGVTDDVKQMRLIEWTIDEQGRKMVDLMYG